MTKLIVGIAFIIVSFLIPSKEPNIIKTFVDAFCLCISVLLFIIGACMTAVGVDDVFQK